ncbi:MAG: calcium-binding protein, partial [Alphaproteobacteria bacterium]|nr:calcium-binding protein [Alphaproteobacteria bacterium]
MSTLTEKYYQFLCEVEGVESLVYYDTATPVRPTIGIGFNISDSYYTPKSVANAVINQLLYDGREPLEDEIKADAAYISAIEDALSVITTTATLRTTLNNIMLDRSNNGGFSYTEEEGWKRTITVNDEPVIIDSEEPRTSFELTNADTKSVFNSLASDYETSLKTDISSDVWDELSTSEKVALFSLKWNAGSLIGPRIEHALDLYTGGSNSNSKFIGKLLAWHEIFYGSNSSDHYGLQNRRVKEAAKFLGKTDYSDISVDVTSSEQAKILVAFLNSEYSSMYSQLKDICLDTTATTGYGTPSSRKAYIAKHYKSAVNTLFSELGISSNDHPINKLFSEWNIVVDLDFGTSSYTIDGSTFTSLNGTVSTDAGSTITGTSVVDIIFGEGGHDTISGGDGDDYIYGGDGVDAIHGGTGDDKIYGGAGDDTIHGEDGADYIEGGDGYDIIHGGDDGDTIYGGAFYDDLYGEGGNDKLYGGDGTDDIQGGSGNDTIRGGDGIDFISGGTGNDIIYGVSRSITDPTGYANSDHIDGGAGYDAFFAESSYGIQLDMAATDIETVSTWKDANLNDYITAEGKSENITVRTYGGDDTIIGGSGKNSLYGGSGIDTIFGGSRTDHLYGEAGNDILRGKASRDVLYGGKGNDTLYGGSGGDKYIYEASGGRDTIDDSSGNDSLYINENILKHYIAGNQTDYVIITSHSGRILIKDFYEEGDEGYTEGDGYIERIFDRNGNIVTAETHPEEPEEPVEEPEEGDPADEYNDDDNPDNINPDPDSGWDGPMEKPIMLPGDYADALAANVTSNADPIVIDLDGDGVEIVPASGIHYFDLNGDGIAHDVDWISGDDGFLFDDANANNIADGIDELFGNATTDGIDELKALDDNGDGKIDSSDAGFSRLKVWQDHNQNGVCDDGEVTSLQDLGATQIGIKSTNSISSQTIEGNKVDNVAVLTKSDGSTNSVHDVFFTIKSNSNIYTGDQEILDEVLLLPNLKGFGNVADLHIAASRDAELRTLLTEISNIDAANAGDIIAKAEELLVKWTDVDGISADEMSQQYSKRKLHAIVKFVGADEVPDMIETSKTCRILDGMYQGALMSIRKSLLAQTVFSGFENYTGRYFAPFNRVTVSGTDDFAALIGELQSSVTADNAELWITIEQMLRQEKEATGISDVAYDELVVGLLKNKCEYGEYIADKIASGTYEILNNGHTFAFNHSNNEEGRYALGNDSLNAFFTGKNNIIMARGGNDKIYAYDGGNVLIGGAGDDEICSYGDVGSITIGGAGNDTLYSQVGDDTYVFNVGDGVDKISDGGGVDKIIFGEGITQDDIVMRRTGNYSLYIGFVNNPDDGIVITGLFGTNNYGVEFIEFADGSEIFLREGLSYTGTAGNDMVRGDDSNNTLKGLAGDDEFLDYAGNDVVIGGAGNDEIYNAGGNDTYVFNLGDGR